MGLVFRNVQVRAINFGVEVIDLNNNKRDSFPSYDFLSELLSRNVRRDSTSSWILAPFALTFTCVPPPPLREHLGYASASKCLIVCFLFEYCYVIFP